MFKAIIFDYGGVIGTDPSEKIYKSVCKKFNVSYRKIKTETSRLISKLDKDEISEREFWRKLAVKFGISAKELKRVWMGTYRKNAKLNKELLPFIKKLNERRYKICLLTNTARFYKKSIKGFSLKVYSCDVKMRKPERKIYEFLLKKLGFKANECIIIDNNPKNLIVPKKMGMKAIKFISTKQLKLSLSKLLSL
jgi:putative hydrolase of the HAD superfamily